MRTEYVKSGTAYVRVCVRGLETLKAAA